jgi:hypothetical protein
MLVPLDHLADGDAGPAGRAGREGQAARGGRACPAGRLRRAASRIRAGLPATAPVRGLLPAALRRVATLRGDEGMTTAEYAVGTLAAVAFAGVLLKVVTSGAVQAALAAIVQRALR